MIEFIAAGQPATMGLVATGLLLLAAFGGRL